MGKVRIYTEDSELNFGKHSGKRICDILKTEEAYLKWCIKNVKSFVIDDDLLTKLFKDNRELVRKSGFLLEPAIDSYKRINDEKLSVLQCQNIESNNSIDYNNVFIEESICSNRNWLIDSAGTDDPEVMNDVYWNID